MAGENYAGNMGESHGSSVSGDIWVARSNRGGETGLTFWDLSNPKKPIKISHFSLKGLVGGDYSNNPWWISWQGNRYVYVAAANGGLYIVDASDVRSCVLVHEWLHHLGGFRVNTVAAIGNMLVLTNSEGGGNGKGGISILDISDPGNPELLETVRGKGIGKPATHLL